MAEQRKPIETLDRSIAATLATVSMPVLRMSLGVIYLWFGALKICGASPVEEFVARTIPFLPRRLVVRALGVWEVAIGLALLLRVALRPTLLLFAVQLAGTFTPFVVQPRRMVRNGNPLLLTIEGEFVLKNLVLLAAGLAVGSTIRRDDETLPPDDAALRT